MGRSRSRSPSVDYRSNRTRSSGEYRDRDHPEEDRYRSRSPIRRRGSRSPDRRGRSRSPNKRYRSRSPRRYRSRSRERRRRSRSSDRRRRVSRSPSRRHRSPERRKHESKTRSNEHRDSRETKPKAPSVKSPEPEASTEVEMDDEQKMMALMGIGGFTSTKVRTKAGNNFIFTLLTLSCRGNMSPVTILVLQI
ncbi:hypothetical protein K7432_005738 [Basidiobolus ranarum]|uniref:U4/U6.U5 small nuclear ribonucleoprotein 27kDa protein domain-containing protein n=1 Tax=Basidiobolus ranarum TaxID=34480 RepID=A0ABR2WW20_9FUNG